MSMAENTVVRRTETADGQTICRSPVEDKERLAFDFEQLAKSLLCFRRDCVRPVTDDVPGARTLKRFENFRATPGIVVTRKLSPMIKTPHAHILKWDKVA